MFPKDIYVNDNFKRKFNLYAMEALPNEIGGIARVQETEDGIFYTDFHLLPQTASSVTFEIDPEEVHAWTQSMIEQGRIDELSEWKSIIHSHPVGCSPSMSSTDVEAIERYAGEGEAFSLIMTASKSGDSNKFLTHYCVNTQHGHVLVQDIPVLTSWSEASWSEVQRVKAEVKELIKPEVIAVRKRTWDKPKKDWWTEMGWEKEDYYDYDV